MFNFSKILPKTVTNELDSPKIAVWGFILFTGLNDLALDNTHAV
jgi:hypothetical protein